MLPQEKKYILLKVKLSIRVINSFKSETKQLKPFKKGKIGFSLSLLDGETLNIKQVERQKKQTIKKLFCLKIFFSILYL